MDNIDLLLMRYRDYLASNDALQFVSDHIITGSFEATAQRNRIHVRLEYLSELAAEIGSPVLKKPLNHYPNKTEFYIRYKGVTIYALGDSYGAP
jgi:hypothetical protein